MPDPAPQQVIENRFELLEPAPAAGLGDCWKARDRRFRQRSKLVRLFPPLAPGAALPERALKALQALRNPGALEVIHHGAWEGRPFVVHDWFDGTSLERALAELPAASALSLEVVRGVVDLVCGVLEAALLLNPPLTHGALSARDILVRGLDVRPEVRVVGIGLAALDGRSEGTSADDVRAVGAVMRALLSTADASDGRWREGTPSEVVTWIERCEGLSGGHTPTIKALRDGLRGAWNSPAVARAPSPVAPPAAPPASVAPVAATRPPVAEPAPMPAPPPVVNAAHDAPAAHATDEVADMTVRTPFPARRTAATAPIAPAPQAPDARGERTVALTTLASPSPDEDEHDATRRAAPLVQRAPVRAVGNDPAEEPVEHGGGTVMLTTLPTSSADDPFFEGTQRVTNPRSPRPVEVDDETSRLPIRPPVEVVRIAPQGAPAPTLPAPTPPRPAASSEVAPAKRPMGLLAVTAVMIVLAAGALVFLLTR